MPGEPWLEDLEISVISSDSLQLAMVEETTPGTTPATPAFMLWRTTGEGLVFSPNTSESGEIGSGGRFKQPSNVTGMGISGDINFELAKFPALDAAIEGVMASAWGECPAKPGSAATSMANRITAGETLKTYTIEKRFPDPATPGSFLYQRFTGVSFSTLSLSVSPNQTITGSVGIVGGVPTVGTTAITGATYTSAGNNPVFTAPEVSAITIGTALGVGTHCWTSLNINIDSGNRGIPCIGSQGDREIALGTMSAQISGDVYFQDQSILNALLTNAAMGDGHVTLEDGTNIYRFDLYGLKPTAGSLAAGGAGQDLVIPVTFEPTPKPVCEDTGPPVVQWSSGLIISTVDTAPTLP